METLTFTKEQKIEYFFDACELNIGEVVKYLLAEKDGILYLCCKNDSMESPLVNACKNQSVDVVRVLLDAGSKLSKDDFAELLAECIGEDINGSNIIMAKLICESHPDSFINESYNEINTFKRAFDSEKIKMFRYLFNEYEHTDSKMIAEFMFGLIGSGDVDELKQLLAIKDLEFNINDHFQGLTLLHMAYIKDYVEIGKFLLEAGADPKIKLDMEELKNDVEVLEFNDEDILLMLDSMGKSFEDFIKECRELNNDSDVEERDVKYSDVRNDNKDTEEDAEEDAEEEYERLKKKFHEDFDEQINNSKNSNYCMFS